MRKLLLLGAATALFLASSLEASCGSCSSSNKKESHCKEPSLVGTYTLSLSFPRGPGYGNICFHEGGTLHGQNSADIGQLIDFQAPNGAVSTVWTGNWEKIRKRTYYIFYTAVVALKNGEDCCPSFPFGRLKVEGTVTLSPDGQQLATNLEISFWDLNDLTLNTNNIIPPSPSPMMGMRVGPPPATKK